MTDHLQKIAIVGASGQIGSTTLKHLLESSQGFKVTVITRTESQATFPFNVIVKKGSYTDGSFLEDAFKGQDAVMFAVHFHAQDAQLAMFEAAAKAGVKWIIPNEYAGNTLNDGMVALSPAFQPKRKARKHIEELSKTYEGLKWIGVATNPFLEPFLVKSAKVFGIDTDSHTATLYPDAGKFNTSTMDRIGLSITRLLSLPVADSAKPHASLQHYANNFLYVSSYCVTQTDLLHAIQKARRESEADWKVTKDKTVEQWIGQCQEGVKQRNMMAGFGLTVAAYIGEGRGGNYEDKAQEDRKALGLPEEKDFERAVKKALEGAETVPKPS